MTTCQKVQPNLLDYSRGELSAFEAAQVKLHLALCPDCRSTLAEEKLFVRILESFDPVEPRRDVWPAIEARTEPGMGAASRVSGAFASLWRRAAALALSAAVVAGIFFATRETSKPPESALLSPTAVAVSWSDDPLGKHADATLDYLSNL